MGTDSGSPARVSRRSVLSEVRYSQADGTPRTLREPISRLVLKKIEAILWIEDQSLTLIFESQAIGPRRPTTAGPFVPYVDEVFTPDLPR